MSKMNPKKFSTILHSQLNYHTLPVTPFKLVLNKLNIGFMGFFVVRGLL